jgi:two-component system, chemotaxis family, chemotaxis protein CheY
MARILIVDDNLTARGILRRIIESCDGWTVCGEAAGGIDAVQQAARIVPDIIVLDFQMPVMNGIRTARELAKVTPKIPVLLCSAYLSSGLVSEAMRAGIRGTVSKLEGTAIVDGIAALLRNERFYGSAEAD